jgi:predicted RNase H-like nuclease (RuvC/YqgF family)
MINICVSKHSTIAFEGRVCPLCDHDAVSQTRIDSLCEEVEDLILDEKELQAEVKKLKAEVEKLKKHV